MFMTWGHWYWPVFLIVASVVIIVGFVPAEIIALLSEVRNHTDNTLSYYARTELGVSVAVQNTVHTVAWWASFVLYLLFNAFIIPHIWFVQFG